MIFTKNDTLNLKKNVLAGSQEMAKFEMQYFLERNKIRDFEISVSMPAGHVVHLVSEDAGRSIHGSFEPFLKSQREQAEIQKELDLQAASRAVKIDRSLDGIINADNNKKLEAMHGKVKHRL